MTNLFDGALLERDSPRIIAIDAIDELNSHIAVVLAYGVPADVRDCLGEVQRRLLEVCSQLNSPGDHRITEQDVLAMEDAAERFGEQAESEQFVLPGGSLAAAACHVARSVCRRAEAHVVGLNTMDPPRNDFLVPFLNRLSHLLLVVARSPNLTR